MLSRQDSATSSDDKVAALPLTTPQRSRTSVNIRDTKVEDTFSPIRSSFKATPKRTKTKQSILNAAVEHTSSLLQTMKPFSKNFYRESAIIAMMSDREAKRFKDQLQVRVGSYSTIPRPIQTIQQAGFDNHMLEEIRAADCMTPTSVQSQVIPLALSGYDLVAISLSGTGKTLAYVWPLIVHVVHQPPSDHYEGPVGLILTHTRSHAAILAEEVRKYGAVYKLKVSVMEVDLEERPEILITTPDAVMDYLHGRPNGLHRCSFAAVDNVDTLVEMNLEYQMKTAANHLRGSGERQILLMGSAWNVRVEAFARQILNKECVRVIVGPISENPNLSAEEVEEQQETKVAVKAIPYRDSEHVAKLRRHLLTIYLNQTKRSTSLRLAKAFLKWSREVPLTQKCDEMVKQLKERNSMVESIRSSYLRDVISIKHFLDQLKTIDVNKPSSVEDMHDSLQNLHTVPSVDLREAIDKVRSNMNQSSTQLRDNLIDAGLLDPSTCKTLNPWEQSRSFRRLQRQRGAPSYQYPDAGGESVFIKAPSNYKLFVRHCGNCIGIMQLVKSWNTEIETAFRQMADYQIVDAQISEFKKLIAQLTLMVADKEAEVIRLNVKNTELEVANAWFDKWSFIKESAEREEVIHEQKRVLSNIAGMSNADIESTAYNYALRMEARYVVHEEQIRVLKTAIKKDKGESEKNTQHRLALCDDLRNMEILLQNKTSDYESLMRQKELDRVAYQAMEARLEKVETVNSNLQKALDLKESQYDELRSSSADKIDRMQQALDAANDEYNSKESEADSLREDLRAKRAQIAAQQKELQTVKTQLKESEERAVELAARIPDPVPEKRKRNFKVIAKVVLATIKLSRTTTRINYLDIATKHQLSSFREDSVHLKQRVASLTSEVEELDADLAKMSTEGAITRELLLKTQINLGHSQATEQKLSVTIDERDEQIRQILSEMYANQNALTSSAATQQQFYHDTIIEYGKNITHGKILAQLQRSMADQLCESLFAVRSVVHALDIDNQIKAMNNKPSEAPSTRTSLVLNPNNGGSIGGNRMSMTSGNSLLSIAARLKRRNVLMASLKENARSLITFMEMNRRSHRLTPYCLHIDTQHIICNEKKLVSRRTQYLQKDLLKDNCSAEEAGLINNIFATSDVRNQLLSDFLQLFKIRHNTMQDMRSVEKYIYFLRGRANDLSLRVTVLESKEQELAALKKKFLDRSIASRNSSEKPKPRISNIKSTFTHMLEEDNVAGYWKSIISAVVTVQQEHGHLYDSSIDGGSTVEGGPSGQLAGGSTQTPPPGSAKNRSKKGRAKSRAPPTNRSVLMPSAEAEVETEGEVKVPQKRNSHIQKQKQASQTSSFSKQSQELPPQSPQPSAQLPLTKGSLSMMGTSSAKLLRGLSGKILQPIDETPTITQIDTATAESATIDITSPTAIQQASKQWDQPNASVETGIATKEADSADPPRRQSSSSLLKKSLAHGKGKQQQPQLHQQPEESLPSETEVPSNRVKSISPPISSPPLVTETPFEMSTDADAVITTVGSVQKEPPEEKAQKQLQPQQKEQSPRYKDVKQVVDPPPTQAKTKVPVQKTAAPSSESSAILDAPQPEKVVERKVSPRPVAIHTTDGETARPTAAETVPTIKSHNKTTTESTQREVQPASKAVTIAKQVEVPRESILNESHENSTSTPVSVDESAPQLTLSVPESRPARSSIHKATRSRSGSMHADLAVETTPSSGPTAMRSPSPNSLGSGSPFTLRKRLSSSTAMKLTSPLASNSNLAAMVPAMSRQGSIIALDRDDNPESQVEQAGYDPSDSMQSGGGLSDFGRSPARRASMGKNQRASFNMNYIAPHRPQSFASGGGGSMYNTFMSNAVETENADEEEEDPLHLVEPSFDDIDFDDVFDDDDNADEEADYNYLTDLEITKLEAIAMLKRDNETREIIDNLTASNAALTSKVNSLSRDLHERRTGSTKVEKDYEQVCKDVDRLSGEYERMKRQNELLREVVEEGYRFHHTEVDKILLERQRADFERSLLVVKPKQDQSTQIACSVCAIRDVLTGDEDAYCRPVSPHRINNDAGSVDYDADTIVTVHEGLAVALEGNVVLTTKNRRGINDGGGGTRMSSAGAIRSSNSSRPMSPTLKIPNVLSTTTMGTNTVNSKMPPRANNSTNDLLLSSRQLVADSSGSGVRPQSSHDRVFHSRAPNDRALSPPSQLHNSQSTNAMAHIRPQSASPYLHNAESAPNLRALPADQSKFSKLKKMPAKPLQGSSSGIAASSSAGAAILGASASRSRIVPRNDLTSRTLTNTAAYLQHKIVEDSTQRYVADNKRAYSAGVTQSGGNYGGFNNQQQQQLQSGGERRDYRGANRSGASWRSGPQDDNDEEIYYTSGEN